ncbi:Ribonuclease VapC (fragment) [Candidatus Sulfotelmatobacter kueseliae]|uniref:Ribonuclease VapC n=1 Tax=Candidatus Sulfotelmatobacter kueseliae TaxID=2042962 RepID=A0A2U3K610_9BACT
MDYVNVPKIGSGAAFVNTQQGAKDEWRLSASGRQEGVSVRDTLSSCRTAPLKPREGLNGAPAWIATFCLLHGHRLLHRDRDFYAFEKVLGLEVVKG